MFNKAGLTALTSFLVASVSLNAAAQDQGPFTKSELTTSHSVMELTTVNFFAPGTASLMARGQDADDNKQFSFFEMNGGNTLASEPRLTVTMPEDAIFFDFAHIYSDEQESLLFLNSKGVQVLDTATGEVKKLADVSSVYKQDGSPVFNQSNFAEDMNGDGLSDLIIPEFGGYRLLLNDGQGGFASETRLDMQVEMRLRGDTPRYSQFPVHAFDANFDGRTDVVFQRDNSFLSFLQQEDGSYATKAEDYGFDIEIVGNSFKAQVASNERYNDQSDLAETVINTIEDINGDGVMDIVTQTDRAKGVFNRSTTYGFHYGYESNGRLVFDKAPSSAVSMKGFTANTRYIDFAKDGRKDFAGGSVNMGIGKIIGILLSGSVSIPVMFYEQGEDGQFSEDPNYRKKISVDFDMSSGQSSVPVVEMTDIDGDGNKDLILSKENESLRIYKASPGKKKMFAKRAIEIDIDLPKNGEQLTTTDLNGDGKGDLVMHYDRLGGDGEAKRNKLVVLVAN
jgi:hypothetical protein